MSRSRPLPHIAPIAPQLGKPFHRDGWVFEEKYDGWRIVAYKDGGSIRLLSRTGRDHAKRFPEVTAAVAALPGSTAIVDAEVCVFDKHLVSQFHLLDGPGDELATPPVLMAFDCLYLRGRDLRGRPLRDRRKYLEDAVAGASLIYPARRLANDGLEAWATVQKWALEGLVAKDERASYDERARWVKVKVRHEAAFLIGGLVIKDDRTAILVGERDGRALRFRGCVQFGVGLRRLEPILNVLPSIRRAASPFAEVQGRSVWVDPVFSAEISYSEMMRGLLRDPVLRSVRRLRR